MKKNLLLLVFMLGCIYSLTLMADETNYFPTYDEINLLSQSSSIGDFTSNPLSNFLICLKKYKIKAYLEFGTGLGTGYFLEYCNKVISVDFVTPGYGPETIKNYLEVYSKSSNWTPIVFFSEYEGNTQWAPYKYHGSEHIHKAASYQCATHQNYALIDDFYLIELNAFIAKLVKYNKFQVGFVNSGLYFRGDLVQLMFGKIPIIIAHDTSCRAVGEKNDVYGYSRVVTPDDYEEIFIPYGQGFTVWIQKNDKYIPLIQELKDLIL